MTEQQALKLLRKLGYIVLTPEEVASIRSQFQLRTDDPLDTWLVEHGNFVRPTTHQERQMLGC